MRWPWGSAKPRVGDWQQPPRPTHAADRDSAPAVAASARTHQINGNPDRVRLSKPPPRRVPSAQGDEATPIFDAVMCDDGWWDLPSAHPLWRKYHPLATQFEVALILDLERADMDAAELDAFEDELRHDAMVDVDFGWGETAVEDVTWHEHQHVVMTARLVPDLPWFRNPLTIPRMSGSIAERADR